MSFDINWDKLVSDDTISNSIREFLNDQFNEISLPSFVDSLSVTGLSLGQTPPCITIRHIGNPFDEFYNDNDTEEELKTNQAPDSPSSSDDDSSDEEVALNSTTDIMAHHDPAFPPHEPTLNASRQNMEATKHFNNFNMTNVGLGHSDLDTPTNFFSHNAYRLHSNSATRTEIPKRNDNDIQFILEIDYKGSAAIEITVNLLVNYPSTHFITLPIKLNITDLVIHSLAAVAYLENSVFLSFLCDLNDTESDYFSSPTQRPSTDSSSYGSQQPLFNGGNITDYATSSNKERMDVIKSVKIESEIGEIETNVLRNVGKVEKFLVEQLRSIIRDETAWPSWICLDFNSGEESEISLISTDNSSTTPTA